MNYTNREWFFSIAEIRFYEVLKQLFKEKFLIFPHVRMEDLVKANDFRGRAQIRGRHADFVICSTGEKIKIIMIIELDDRTHAYPKNHARDILIDNIYQSTGLPIAHVKCQKKYDLEELRRQLKLIYLKSRRSKNSPPVSADNLSADNQKPEQSDIEKEKKGL